MTAIPETDFDRERPVANSDGWQDEPPDDGDLLERRPIRPQSTESEDRDLLRIAMGKRFLHGGSFVLDAPAVPRAVWGDGDRVLWAEGEPVMVVGPTGVGKTTLMQQVVLGRLGLRNTFLGFSIETGAARVLYLACDRPSQAQRSLARMVTEEHRQLLDERLRVWKGPLPGDLMKDPQLLLSMADEAGAGTLIVDSLKDIAHKLGDDETGTRINSAFQLCVSEGVEVAVLHHSRKGQADNKKPNTIDDVYGSTWFTAGMGSVLSVWGKAGDPVVELSHLKQPAEQIEPLTILHDHRAGVSTVEGAVDLLSVVRSSRGLTVEAGARALYRVEKADRNQIEKARYQLDKLAAKCLVEKREHGRNESDGRQRPVSYWPKEVTT